MLTALTLLGACSDKATSSDTGGEGEGEGEGSNGLPDLVSGFETDGCEDWTDNDGTVYQITGAVSYFYGEYEDNGDGTWTGTEYWYLYANDTWKEAGGADCQMYWAASGTEGESGACPTCDLAIDVTLQLDVTETNCPEDLYESEASGSASYAIKHSNDDEATWYFASSGKQFGAGYYNSEAMNFATEFACKWF